MKRLDLDIETSPNVGFFWSAGYKVNISHEQILEERKIITASFGWHGKKKIYDLKWDKDRNDEKMTYDLVEVMNDADEIVAHYGDGFDIPWVRTRAMFHGIVVPNWKTVDTKAWSSKYFFLNSNKLDYLAQYLGIGCKIRTEYDLWKIATKGSDRASKEAVSRMVRYNRHDVDLLRPVYERLSLYCPIHTHQGVFEGKERWSCPKCASEHVGVENRVVSKSGMLSFNMQCRDCLKYYKISNTAHNQFTKRKK